MYNYLILDYRYKFGIHPSPMVSKATELGEGVWRQRRDLVSTDPERLPGRGEELKVKSSQSWKKN